MYDENADECLIHSNQTEQSIPITSILLRSCLLCQAALRVRSGQRDKRKWYVLFSGN